MARFIHGLSGGASSSSDVYFPLLSGASCVANLTVQADAQTKLNRGTAWSSMYIQLTANTSASTSIAYFQKDGVNGNASISIPAAATGRFENTTAFDSVASGQVVGIYFDRGGTSTISNLGSYCDESRNINTVGCFGSNNFNTASSTIEVPQIGLLRSSGVGANGRVPNLAAMTSRNLQCYVSSNTCSTTTVIQQRINNANATPSISVVAGATGRFENTTDTQAYAVNDELYYQVIRGTGVGNFIMTVIAQDQQYPTPTQQIYQMEVTGRAWNSTLPVYTHPTGSFTTTGFESNVQMKLLGTGRISKFYSRLSSNAATDTVTWTLRKNAASTSLATTYAAGVSGTVSDTVDTVSFVNGDLIAIEYSKPLGTGTSTSRWFTFLVEYDEFIPQIMFS